MSDWRELADEINKLEYLYLRKVESITGWGLNITVDEIVPRHGPENLDRDFHPELATRLRASIQSQPHRIPRAYQISFHEAICYLVQNESYCRYPEPPELFAGRLFRTFSQSHLLDLASKTTYASADHPGPEPLQHFSVVCQDDIVDVIACVKPLIQKVDPK